jgi:hypothetical protein
MIAGIIVQGTAPKPVLIRAAGPSLGAFGVPNPLPNPRLELHNGAGTVVGMNDDWMTTQIGGLITSDQVAQIQASGLAPADPLESAMIVNLPPGNYTAIVEGVNGGTGVAIVEAYDIGPSANSLLAEISTRGFVLTGDSAMIGGFIVINQSTQVVVRGIGPSLTQFGVPDALPDPILELHGPAGFTTVTNDNWMDGNCAGSGLTPSNPLESCIEATLPPGNYTAIVRGVNNTTGNALVEVYDIQ